MMYNTRIEKFNPVRIEQLKMILENAVEKGTPRYFEIYVDGIKVIDKTNDVNEFDHFQNFKSDETQTIKILIYSASATSPKNDRFIFKFYEETENEEVLNGVEMENKIASAIQHQKEKWDYELLKKENEELKEELSDAEEYVEKLEEKCSEYERNKNTFKGINLGELAGAAIESVIRNNVDFIAKIPATKGLAGLIAKDNAKNSSAETTTEPEAKVSFQEVEPESEQEKQLTILVKEILKRFDGENEMQNVVSILNSLANDKTKITTTTQFLNNK